MPFVHENVKVELFPGTPSPIVYLSENDVGDTLAFELIYKGQPVNVPNGSAVKFKGTKKNGLGFTVDSSNVSGNVVSFIVSEDMTSCSGVVEAEISITLSNNKHGTCNVVLIVEKNPHSDGTQDGSYPQIVSEMRELVEQIEGDAETASNAANTAVAAKNSALEIQQDVHQYTASAIDNWLTDHPEATTTVQDGSLTYKKLVTGTLGFVTPEMFGAKGDGITNDREAVQNCLNSGLLVIADGTYLLGDQNDIPSNKFFITIPNGCHIIGGTFKFPASSWECFGMFIGNNFTIENAVFDMNGVNNIADTTTHRMYAICSTACNGIKVINSRFKDSAGRNYIFVSAGNDLVLQNCRFKNGGTTLSGNEDVQNDFSYVFSAASKTYIINCVIEEPDNDPYTYCGGFEIHNGESFVENCIINKCLPAIYVAPQAHEEYRETIKNVTIKNNVFNKCASGISIQSGVSYENITIVNNTIDLARTITAEPHPYGISSGSDVNNLVIANNKIFVSRTSTNFAVRAITLYSVNRLTIQDNYLESNDMSVYMRANGAFTDVKIINNVMVKLTEGSFAIYKEITAECTGLLVSNNSLENYIYIFNAVLNLHEALIECKVSEVRPAIAFSGIFRCEDLYTSGDWEIKLDRREVIMMQNVTLTNADYTRFDFPTTIYKVIQASIVGYGTSTEHIEQFGTIATGLVNAKTNISSCTALLTIRGRIIQ